MKNALLNVNPAILRWAREERGYSLEEIAERIEKDSSIVKRWESDGKDVSFTDLKKLAKAYKRQISAFFLRDVPEKTKVPKDRRNLKVNDTDLSPETLLAVRRTSRYLHIAKELVNADVSAAQYEWLEHIKQAGSLEHASTQLREMLGVTVGDQIKIRDSQTALRLWRERIETKLNIFTFSFLMPQDELDGFSYIEEGYPYAITLNSRNSKNRNIFTLFHELGHILEGSSGICLTMQNGNVSNAEQRCNHFAAELLMPREVIKSAVSYDELRILAGELCVSTEAYARRAHALDLISQPVLESFLRVILVKQPPKKSKGEMRISPIVMSKSRRGEKFFNLIVDAYDSGRLSSSAVTDILQVRPTRIDKP